MKPSPRQQLEMRNAIDAMKPLELESMLSGMVLESLWSCLSRTSS
jgi:hypothetical protein